MAEQSSSPETPAAVLAAVRSEAAAADRAEARKLRLAVEWASMHSVDSIADAATIRLEGYGDTGLAIAGPGAPLVAEFSVPEFAAAVGMTTDAGRAYLGEAVELRHRLPRVWHRVRTGDLAAWKARRIARATIALSRDAAAYVDAMVSPVAHKIGPYQLDRLIEEAIARLMPDEAEKRRRLAADGRRFDVHTRDTSLNGTAAVSGELDLADALDLDAAVTAGAEQLRALGSQDSLDVRRATAVGELARRQQTLDLNTSTTNDGESCPAPQRRARQVVLYAHLSDEAIHDPALGDLGRLENTRSLITAEQVRLWCANPDTQVVVKPVIDLADHVHVSAYEVPDRLHEAAALRDVTCVFPFCTRPARGCRPEEHHADCDHITPYDPARAPTCSCNLAPLCRRHHRLKTHGGWRYAPVEPGTYLWTSPLGLSYLRDHDGTLDVTLHRPATACAHPPDS
jgi:hypothetical protein